MKLKTKETKMPRIVHLGIVAENPDRAMKFYKEAFGWSFDKWKGGSMDYWLFMTGKEGEPGKTGHGKSP